MYKPFDLTETEIKQVSEIFEKVAPNLFKRQINYVRGINEFATVDRSVAIPAFEFVYDVIIHKYVTNILFKGTLKGAQAQNTAINYWVKQSCTNNLTGAHMLKKAIQQIYKELQTIK